MIKRFFRCVGQIVRISVFAVITVILVGNIYISAAKSVFKKADPTFFGFSDSVVLTGSMSGTLEPNDVIITRRQEKYSVGDIITFRSGSVTVTHRIVALDGDGYRTKGDANNAPDEQTVEGEFVTGKVIFSIPKLGALILFVKTPAGMLSFIVLAAVIIELPHIVKHIKESKSRNA